MATRLNTYAAITAPTHTLASLASSSSLVTGRQSAVIDNSTTRYTDVAIKQKITTGTSPSAGTIELWAVPFYDGSTGPDVFTTAGDAAKTATSRDILRGGCKLIASTPTDTTSNQTYELSAPSLRDVFGTVPQKVGLFVTHNTGVNLNSTAGNHAAVVEGTYDSF